MAMEWDRLLNAGRLCRPDFPEAPGRPAYLQDYDRILFSEPFRRLAQKTQVHPLYEHDHVHHRMIHSLETASAGRSLGVLAGQAMLEQGHITEAQREVIAGTVQAACLVHDIGNPPFGHSGEDSIGQWFAQQFQAETGMAGAIPQAQQAEFEAFEGNAQGFRIAAALEMARRDGGMRLSYATLAAFMKYPCTAEAQKLAQLRDLLRPGFAREMALIFDYLRGKTAEEIAADEAMQLALSTYRSAVADIVGEDAAETALALLLGTLLLEFMSGR